MSCCNTVGKSRDANTAEAKRAGRGSSAWAATPAMIPFARYPVCGPQTSWRGPSSAIAGSSGWAFGAGAATLRCSRSI